VYYAKHKVESEILCFEVKITFQLKTHIYFFNPPVQDGTG